MTKTRAKQRKGQSEQKGKRATKRRNTGKEKLWSQIRRENG